jgi:hypothetical protein
LRLREIRQMRLRPKLRFCRPKRYQRQSQESAVIRQIACFHRILLSVLGTGVVQFNSRQALFHKGYELLYKAAILEEEKPRVSS